MKLTPMYAISDASLTFACAVRRYVLPGTTPASSWPAPPAPAPTRSADVPEFACPETTLMLPQSIQPVIPFSNPAFETMLPEAGAGAAAAAGAITDCCASAKAATGFNCADAAPLGATSAPPPPPQPATASASATAPAPLTHRSARVSF